MPINNTSIEISLQSSRLNDGESSFSLSAPLFVVLACADLGAVRLFDVLGVLDGFGVFGDFAELFPGFLVLGVFGVLTCVCLGGVGFAWFGFFAGPCLCCNPGVPAFRL